MTKTQNQKIGILGGSFDPIHNGHITLALAAADRLELNKVLLLVTAAPKYKIPFASVDDRLNMVKLAAMCDVRLEASDIDLHMPAGSCTCDTVAKLRELHSDANIAFIMGSDEASSLYCWKKSSELARIVSVASFSRKNVLVSDLTTTKAMGFKVSEYRADFPDISSTSIRMHLRTGNSVEHLVPAVVLDYIYEKGLYI